MTFKFARGSAIAGTIGILLAAGVGAAAPATAATNCYYQEVELLSEFQDQGGTSCNDLNVAYAKTNRTDISGTDYWGEYLSAGSWKKGAAGQKFMTNGQQSPWKVFISSVAGGTYERMRGFNGARVGTYT